MSEPTHWATCRAAEEELGPGTAYEVENPLARRTWTDAEAVVWRRRGDGVLSPRQSRRLLGRPDVLLAHVFGGPVHLHEDVDDRRSLLDELERYWRGDDPDPMHDYTVGELRAAGGRAMAVVRETC